jgi:hypothetical protein
MEKHMKKTIEIPSEKIQKAMKDNQIKDEGGVENLKADLANVKWDKTFETWGQAKKVIDEVFEENEELIREYDLTYKLIDMGIAQDRNFAVKIITIDDVHYELGEMTKEEEEEYNNDYNLEREKVIKTLERKIREKLG